MARALPDPAQDHPAQRSRRGLRGALRTRYRSSRHLLPVIIAGYACLLPREFSLPLGVVDMRPYRLAVLLLLPLLLSQLKERPLRLSRLDFLAAFLGSWFVIALTVSGPIEDAFSSGLMQSLDFLLAYFVGRVCLRTPRDFHDFLAAMVPGFALAGLTMVVESITHRPLVHPIASAITGQPLPGGGVELRLGLMRARGPYIHPIIAGAFQASLLPLVLFGLYRAKDRALGWFSVLAFVFSVSSTGFLNFGINLFLSGVYILQKATRWPLLWISSFYTAMFLIAVSFLSEGGLMSFVVRRIAISADTGYYRVAIWNFAGAEANAHPIFGIGMRDWSRPMWMGSDTIDAQWLLLTMRYGYPAGLGAVILFLFAAVLVAMRANRWQIQRERDICKAIAFAIISTVICGLAVALWEGFYFWLIILTGAAVSIVGSAPARRVSAPHDAPAQTLAPGAARRAQAAMRGTRTTPA